MSGAKDDRRDALVLASSLRTDTSLHRQVDLDDPKIIELREWSRMRDDLRQEQVRLKNRVLQQLSRYYPQFLELGAVGATWRIELWKLAPTPAKAAKLSKPLIADLIRKNRVRGRTADQLREILCRPAVTVAPGVTTAAVGHIEMLHARLELTMQRVRKTEKRIEDLISEIQGSDLDLAGDVAILRSVPGVGPAVLAILLVEASKALPRRDHSALRVLSGVAPVTKRSGKSCAVVRRRACNQRLHQALYHWSRVAVLRDQRIKDRYARSRARGHSHGRALRAVADHLLSVACAMLRDGTGYRPHVEATSVA